MYFLCPSTRALQILSDGAIVEVVPSVRQYSTNGVSQCVDCFIANVSGVTIVHCTLCISKCSDFSGHT